MEDFDKFALELGWIKPYSEVPLFYREDDKLCTGAFSTADTYEIYSKAIDLTKEQVSRGISIFSHNKFKIEAKDWVLPILASDYFSHRRDRENELKWAKAAMAANPKLTVYAFSRTIEKDLI